MAYLSTGDVLAERYRIEDEIGRGGYSVVYRATDLTLQTEVALKLLVPPPATEAIARERMRREALVGRGLSHPNVVTLHDFTEVDGRAFLTMEFVDGPDLAARIERAGPLPVEAAVGVAHDIGAALGAAHAQGVLHRDVKPQNVLLSPDGRARLADFGSARLMDMSTVTRTGGLVGTIAYTAPEIVAGERGDARSDLYALGMTLHFVLTGLIPDQRSLHLPPLPSPVGFRPRALRPDVPAWLDDFVATLTREDPGLRYPTAGGVLEALAARDADPAGLAPALAARRECVLCGDVDPIGVGLCSTCLGTGDSNEAANHRLLFVEKVKSHSQRLEIDDWLAEVAGDESSTATIAAARRGELPLARVPAEVGPRIARHLRQMGIPVQITHQANLFGRLSTRLQVVLSTAIVLGLAAGSTVPVMFLLTPAFAGTVLVAALRRQSRGFLAGAQASPLPPKTEAYVRTTLGAMADGAARRLLADFVRMARAVRADGGARGEANRAASDDELDQLVRTAARLARDIEGLDASLTVVERQAAHRSAATGDAWAETHASVSQTRDRLVQRLLDALAALARARAAGVGAGLGERRDLATLARDLAREAELQADARREVEALLA